MRITQEKLSQLAQSETAETGSWAIWSPEFNKKSCVEANRPSIYEYLASRIDELKDNVVLVGLNRSFKQRKGPQSISNRYPTFANFHAAGHAGDGLLKQTISTLENIQGAYMTDLCLDLESSSRKVKIDPSEARQRFSDQLSILFSTRFHVVCFGRDVFKTFVDTISSPVDRLDNGVAKAEVPLHGRQLFCYRVVHYSYAVRYGKQERFKQQMRCVDDLIGATSQ